MNYSFPLLQKPNRMPNILNLCSNLIRTITLMQSLQLCSSKKNVQSLNKFKTLATFTCQLEKAERKEF